MRKKKKKKKKKKKNQPLLYMHTVEPHN